MNIDQVVGHRKIRPTPDCLRHARKCCICRHPRREEIESDYLFWRNPHQIMKRIRSRSPRRDLPTRPCHRPRLPPPRECPRRARFHRRANRRRAGNRSMILRAMRAYSCLTSKGRWINPPKRIIHQITSKATPTTDTPHDTRTPHNSAQPKTARRHKVTRRS